MNERIKTIGRTLRRPRYGIPTVLLLGILLVVIGKMSAGNKPTYETRTIMKTSVVQEVDATGTIKSAESVDLAFETGGKVSVISVKVGDRVNSGKMLASLTNADASANLLSAQARLSLLEKGLRPEDAAVSAASVSSARAAVSNAAASLANAVNDAYVKADDAIRNHADILFSNPQSDSPTFGTTIVAAGTTYTLKATDASMAVTLSTERSDVGKRLDSWKTAYGDSEISSKADSAQENLITIQNLLNNVAGVVNSFTSSSQTTSDVYAGVKAEISTARTSVSAALSNLRSSIQAYASAKSALDVAEKQATLKQAPATREDLQIQIAAVQAAEAAYGRTIIRAPFAGLITKVEPSKGEIVSQNTPVISIISDSQLEIEVNIPEADLPKVRIGALADVTFDAYGKDYVATTSVISIDPAATVIDGVPTYRTVLAFEVLDPRIKSGLTANVTIHGEKKDNVIAVPQRSVITKEGKKIVQIVEGKTVVDKIVETGLRGSDGNIEIVSGLNEGQHYVVTPVSK